VAGPANPWERLMVAGGLREGIKWIETGGLK